jgi:hypothetical protein
LTEINVAGDRRGDHASQRKGSKPMPIETLIVVAAIIVIFGLFGAVLAWADIHSRAARSEQS